jgi:hypothetical protein
MTAAMHGILSLSRWRWPAAARRRPTVVARGVEGRG